MVKNDITYEYRVFTHRLVDIDSMQVGTCTSKIIKELKSKDKVDGRFFHTSDTDEWYFCWNGELQKLNLKGNSDVNAALAEVEKLIGEANTAVSDAKATAKAAADAAAEAKAAAESASAAVESIEGKADQSAVDAVEKAVELKADKTDVEALAASIPTVPTKVSAFENDANYLTEHQDISGKQDVIADLATIRANAELGATAIQEIPDTYATKEYVREQIEGINIPTVPTNVSEFTNDAGYLTKDVADGYYAALGTTGSGNGVDKNYVDTELAKKQDVINDLETIRSGAAAGATALQSVPEEYITETDLADKKFATIDQVNAKQDTIEDLETIRTNAELAKTALQSIPDEYITETDLADKKFATINQVNVKQDAISDLETIRSGAAAGATALQAGDLNGYLTANSDVIVEINSKIAEINTLLGDATALTNTILNA